MKDNKDRKMFDAVGGIGDDLIDEAEHCDAKSARAKRIMRFSAIAASFVIVAVAAVLVIFNRAPKNVGEKVAALPSEPIVFSEDAALAGARMTLPEELRTVSVRAESAAGKVIPTGDSFIVTTGAGCDAETLAEYMSVTPKTALSVTKLSDGEFKVSPAAGALFPGTVYNVSFGDKERPAASYTFQTESELVIKSILPAD
ncbi:MAG: hypothetical protein IJQ80_04700 [Clostridia bacterium]|nr:hypothetical protein [Clostridia bacterium]